MTLALKNGRPATSRKGIHKTYLFLRMNRGADPTNTEVNGVHEASVLALRTPAWCILALANSRRV